MTTVALPLEQKQLSCHSSPSASIAKIQWSWLIKRRVTLNISRTLASNRGRSVHSITYIENNHIQIPRMTYCTATGSGKLSLNVVTSGNDGTTLWTSCVAAAAVSKTGLIGNGLLIHCSQMVTVKVLIANCSVVDDEAESVSLTYIDWSSGSPLRLHTTSGVVVWRKALP